MLTRGSIDQLLGGHKLWKLRENFNWVLHQSSSTV